MHHLSSLIDVQLLAGELSKELSVKMAVNPSSGRVRLRLGPFAAELMASGPRQRLEHFRGVNLGDKLAADPRIDHAV